MPIYGTKAYLVIVQFSAWLADKRAFLEEINRSTAALNINDSTWIVVRTQTLQELANSLRPHLRAEDRLLIMPALGPVDGWMPKEVWDWLNGALVPEPGYSTWGARGLWGAPPPALPKGAPPPS